MIFSKHRSTLEPRLAKRMCSCCAEWSDTDIRMEGKHLRTDCSRVNLHTLDNSSEMDKEARQLINALRTVIENFMIFSKSIYQFLLMILPPLWEPLVRIVSWYLPDRRLKKARQVCDCKHSLTIFYCSDSIGYLNVSISL